MEDGKCPVINQKCRFYCYQKDRNGEVVVCFCNHPDNQNDREGNCTSALCPFKEGA